jgi:predicted aldo/keto reductase-like oxidoreductase
MFKRECELEEKAVSYFRKEKLKYSWQVPINNRVIDLAALDTDGKLIGIEFKLHDWKRALTQAEKNYNSFDFIYICVPGGKYVDKLIKEAKSHGIGVMIYDSQKDTIKVESKAKEITQQWVPNVEYVKDYIIKRGLN